MKKVLKAVGLIAALLLLYYAAQAVVSIILGAGRVVSMLISGAPFDMVGLAKEITTFLAAQTPVITLLAIAVTVPSFYIIYRDRKDDLRSFVRVRAIEPIAVPVLIVFALGLNLTVELVLSLLSRVAFFSRFFQTYSKLSEFILGGGLWLSLLAVGIVGPIFEELMFRGLIFGELRKIMPIKIAVLVQALLFGLYHMNVVQGFYAFLIGILLGFVYYRSGSILAPMIIHLTVNTSSVLLSSLMTKAAYVKWSGAVVSAGVAVFVLTGAYILMSRSFKQAMDDCLYEANRKRKPAPPDGGEAPPTV